MGFFNKIRTDGATYDGQGEKRRGVIDIIQYNGGSDDLVWKFPYNNLSIGAQLVVNNVSSTNSEQSKLCVNGPLYIDARLLWKQTIGGNGS